MTIDFAALAAKLLPQSRSLLASWFPDGRLSGHEFKVGSLAGERGESLSINVETGRWSDFATGQSGGDLVSLYAAAHGLNQAEAARALNGTGGTGTGARASSTAAPITPTWEPIMPVPADAPPPPDDYYRRAPGGEWTKLAFVRRWAYTDAAGALLGYTVRFEWQHGKDIIPQCWCRSSEGKLSWRWHALPVPRPLYNLKGLAERPDAPVLVVEGEKKVTALAVLAPQYVGVSWAGGAAAWRKSDWSPLYGRSILLWPDGDRKRARTAAEAARYRIAPGELIPSREQPGLRAMWALGHQLVKRSGVVKIIIPDDPDHADGWDAADAVSEGWDWQRFKAWALPRVQQLTDGGTNAQTQVVADDEARGVRGAAGAARDDRGAEGGPRSDKRGTAADRARIAGTGSGERVQAGRGERDGDAALSDAEGGAPGARTQALSLIGRWVAWDIERSGNGAAVANLSNAVRVLESDPALARLVWFDEFLQRTRTGSPERDWTDADDIELQLYMQRTIGIGRMSRESVASAVVSMAMRDRRNCVKSMIESEPHDGAPRIAAFLHRVFRCEDSAYTRAASRNFWLSMVARVYQPGCKVDNLIVLEGAQGLFKSSALAAVADPWFAEQHESAVNPKAFAEVLQGKLLVEISEMDAFSRAEVNTIKKVVSCQSDRYRASYDRRAQDWPRQGIMAGSTNKDDWNRDETGARRFWPIRCTGMADIELARKTRVQCFAEARGAFLAGAKWWDMPEEPTRAEQRKRYDADPWIEPISHWLAGRAQTTVNEIAVECLHIDMRDIDRVRQMRIGSCLRALGWVNTGNKRQGSRVVKLWEPGSDLFGAAQEVATEVATKNDVPFQ